MWEFKSPLSYQNIISEARIAQLVEHDLAKVGVAGSSPVSRSKISLDVYHHSGFIMISEANLHPHPHPFAQVAELVDALDLKSSGH